MFLTRSVSLSHYLPTSVGTAHIKEGGALTRGEAPEAKEAESRKWSPSQLKTVLGQRPQGTCDCGRRREGLKTLIKLSPKQLIHFNGVCMHKRQMVSDLRSDDAMYW